MPITGYINKEQRELKSYALKVLPDNGCEHGTVWNEFTGWGMYQARCLDCGAMSVPVPAPTAGQPKKECE